MSIPKTVVINCAGVGSRLGMGTTKSLIKLAGKSLIEWQLSMLEKVEDVRIVVGFQANELIEEVTEIRKDILFVFNHEYLSTKTAASLALGAKYSDGLVISLDGDLLVHPEDFENFLNLEEESLGYCEPVTEEPVLVNLSEGRNGEVFVENFSRSSGDYEWTGLVQMYSQEIKRTDGHVYELLSQKLPMRAVKIRCQEIDTPADYDQALRWVKTYLLSRKGEEYVG